MINQKHIFLSLLLFLILPTLSAQVYSFEDKRIPDKWQIDKGVLEISSKRYKLGQHSLQVKWEKGSILQLGDPAGICEATKSRNGGMNVWLYNEYPLNDSLHFVFKDREGTELCRLPFWMGFKGWRTVWAKFQNDMQMAPSGKIDHAEIQFPRHDEGGQIFIDLLEFTPTVSWQNMTDAHYTVNRTDFSLIPNILVYRRAAPEVDTVIHADREQILRINRRLTNWYLGSGTVESDGDWLKTRGEAEKEFIQRGKRAAQKINIYYEEDGTPIGKPLFPMGAPATIDGIKVDKFRDINERILLPLALDFRKNKQRESLQKAISIYDWFHDQGWADGSGMGTLTFEKLRSSGYFHSFYLLKEHLGNEVFARELHTLHWMSMFGSCYQLSPHTGEVADNLRALALPKLIYALSLPDDREKEIALTAFKHYMDNALSIAPGFYGTIKADFSGYHHRGVYNSAYYPHALYAGALIAYLLHDTPYALSASTLSNLKQGLLTFRFFCANLDIPAGTTGRFPGGQQVLQTLLPAFAYTALSFDVPDSELVAAFRQIVDTRGNRQPIIDYVSNVNSNLAYTSTVGEVELMHRMLSLPAKKEKAVTGTLFMPYSGLFVAKDERIHFNIKGYSRYVWDFESSATENLLGRYLSYGHIEYFDLRGKNRSFIPDEKEYDWNYISGTTAKVLPDELLRDKGGAKSSHRNFSDETFLAGVHATDDIGMFSFRMHDINYDPEFRANKSVFIFKDFLVCIGSDITNKDQMHPTVTTVFQSFGTKENIVFHNEGAIVSDRSLMYAVKEGTVKNIQQGKQLISYIDHGKAPENASYLYFILKKRNMEAAKRLLSADSPIRIISQDNDAHIIFHVQKKVWSAALFNEEKEYNDLVVKKSNIPLSYVAQQNDNHNYRLSICEPDMRRSSHAHMGLLTEEEVVEQEKAHLTKITLNGIFNVVLDSNKSALEVAHNIDKNETEIIFTTIQGKNYSFDIKQRE